MCKTKRTILLSGQFKSLPNRSPVSYTQRIIPNRELIIKFNLKIASHPSNYNFAISSSSNLKKSNCFDASRENLDAIFIVVRKKCGRSHKEIKLQKMADNKINFFARLMIFSAGIFLSLTIYVGSHLALWSAALVSLVFYI